MATTKKSVLTKLATKDFTIHPQTKKVLVSQDKIARLVQTNLDKIRPNADTKSVAVGVVVSF